MAQLFCPARRDRMLRFYFQLMIPFLLHFLLLPAAGYALFRLWRATRSEQRLVNVVIAIGFIGRAVAAQVLFWIAYLQLPFAQHLQVGDGIWFFARDALIYVPAASVLARSGIGAIVAYNTGNASVAFVKTLASFVVLFGDVSSVAVLLNLFCYLGTMAVIVHWSRREPRARLGAAVAICAISLSPAVFLWSLQPLKDTFFQFIVVAFIGACAAWQRLWDAPPIRPRNLALPAAAMIVTLAAISGVRWYFAFALFLATNFFVLLVALTTAARKRVAFAASFVLLVLLSRAFLLGAGPYVPVVVRNILVPWAPVGSDGMPRSLFLRMNLAREGFEKTGGNTAIRLGAKTAGIDRKLHAVPPPAPPPTPLTQPIARHEGTPNDEPTAAAAPSAQLPKSAPVRLLTGTASFVVPRSLGERLGLFRIGGGQGMFWFTELDTLVFDAILLWALVALAMRFSASWRNPMVWFLALLTLLVALPLAYTVTNYGTLFRLRAMVYVALAVIPIALAISMRRDAPLEAS